MGSCPCFPVDDQMPKIFDDDDDEKKDINMETESLCPPKDKFEGFGKVKSNLINRSVVLKAVTIIGAICRGDGSDGKISAKQQQFVFIEFESYTIKQEVIVKHLNKGKEVKNVNNGIADVSKMANVLILELLRTALNAASVDGFA